MPLPCISYLNKFQQFPIVICNVCNAFKNEIFVCSRNDGSTPVVEYQIEIHREKRIVYVKIQKLSKHMPIQ